jgi:ribonuclease Z
VFLTHLHSDHIVGLPDLWLSGWLYREDQPLHIWGPVGTARLSEHLEKAFEFDIHVRRDTGARLPGAGARILAHEIVEGVVFDDGDLLVTAILVDHAPIEPAFAYRIDYSGRSVVISGDTRPSDNIVEAAKSTDVLVHEVVAVDDAMAQNDRIKTIVSHHTTARQAGRVFARSQPRLAVFSHIVLIGNVDTTALAYRARESYGGPVWTGADLDTIEIGDEITVLRSGEPVLVVGVASSVQE